MISLFRLLMSTWFICNWILHWITTLVYSPATHPQPFKYEIEPNGYEPTTSYNTFSRNSSLRGDDVTKQCYGRQRIISVQYIYLIHVLIEHRKPWPRVRCVQEQVRVNIC